MLPSFIIDQIRQRELERERTERPQPTLDLPLPVHRDEETFIRDEEAERGVVIIDLMGK